MFNVHSVHTVHRNDVTSNRVCGAAEVNILFRSRSNQKKGKTEEIDNSRKHWQGRNRQYDATSKPGKVCELDSALCAKKCRTNWKHSNHKNYQNFLSEATQFTN